MIHNEERKNKRFSLTFLLGEELLCCFTLLCHNVRSPHVFVGSVGGSWCSEGIFGEILRTDQNTALGDDYYNTPKGSKSFHNI